MIVISDTSVVSNLVSIDRLDILPRLYGAVIIPTAVKKELQLYDAPINAASSTGWLRTESIKAIDWYDELSARLDAGEAEAIVLAKELGADALLIDERKGRKIAVEQGLPVIGLLGVLIAAKNKGIVEGVKPLVDRMMNENGFRVSPNLYRHVLVVAGEKE